MNDPLDSTIPIIILNWNGLEDTRECMTSVLNIKNMNYKVYLVDNNSDNNEGEILKHEYDHLDQVKVILNSENLGFTRGNNRILEQIIQHEKYKYVVLLNNDTVITPDWLSNLVQSAVINNADMVSSKMVNYYDRSIMDNAGHFMLNTAEILPIGHAQPTEDYTLTKQNMGACGGGALYSTQMIRSIGLFDEFFDTGYEDAEFGLRANKLGYVSIFEPSAQLFHKVSRSIKKIRNEDYFVKIQRNIFYTYVKLMPTKFILLNLPLITAKYLFLFIGGILTLKLNIIKLHIKTLRIFFTKDFAMAIKSRKELKKTHQLNGNTSYLDKIQFFLKTDIKRFIHLFYHDPQV